MWPHEAYEIGRDLQTTGLEGKMQNMTQQESYNISNWQQQWDRCREMEKKCKNYRTDRGIRMVSACVRYIRRHRCREALLCGNNNIIDSETLNAPLLPCPLILVAQQQPLLFLQ